MPQVADQEFLRGETLRLKNYGRNMSREHMSRNKNIKIALSEFTRYYMTRSSVVHLKPLAFVYYEDCPLFPM
jgi:hypothetical protein